MNSLILIMLLSGGLDDDYFVADLAQALSSDPPAVVADTRLRWKQEKLQCRYNPEGSPFALPLVEKMLKAAGSAWELKSGLEFEYAGTTTETPGNVVYDCLISWDLFDNIFKLGQTQNFRIATELVGSDIRLSKLLDEKSLLMVLTHELGHSLGLKHNDKGCIMQTSPNDKHMCFADYSEISHLYPPYEVQGRPALDCTVNLLPGNEVYIPSIDGTFWARYHLNSDLSMTYIEHGKIGENDFFMCK